MPERAFEDPTLPPPGNRSGTGTASIVPYLLKTLATRPQAGTADAARQAALASALAAPGPNAAGPESS